MRDLLTDPNYAAIVRTIIGLSQSLGLQVLAEGVETAAQRDRLLQAGCQNFQGYLYGRPVPEGAIDAVLLAPVGTSFDQFRDYAQRGDSFRRAARALTDAEARA